MSTEEDDDQTPEERRREARQAWLGAEETQGTLKRLREDREQAMRNLLDAALASTDPRVSSWAHYVAALDRTVGTIKGEL